MTTSLTSLLFAVAAAAGCVPDSELYQEANGGNGGRDTGGSGHGGSGAVATCTSDTGPGEPSNNAETSPVVLPAMSDADPATDPQITGMIKGAADTDWYVYTGTDDAYSVVDPYVAFPRDLGLRLCMFFECLSLTTLITCPSGTTVAQSGAGKTGCCATSSSTAFAVMDAYCGVTGGASDDSMRVFIRIDGPDLPAGACVPYSVDYHY